MDFEGLILGTVKGSRFCPAPGCLSHLADLSTKLNQDKDLQIRIRIVSSNFFTDQIIQLVVNLRAEEENELSILRQLIKVLCKMTTPLECLTITGASFSPKLAQDHKQYLLKMKDSFQEPKYTWPIVKLLKIRENLSREKPGEDEILLDCLQLIINLLSISEDVVGSTAAAVIANLQKPSGRYGFIWYLLYQNFDIVVINLCKEHRCTEYVMKILFLLYKEVDAWKIKHQLIDWICQSISSSEYYPDSTLQSSSNGQTNPEVETSGSSKARSDSQPEAAKGGSIDSSSPSSPPTSGSPTPRLNVSPIQGGTEGSLTHSPDIYNRGQGEAEGSDERNPIEDVVPATGGGGIPRRKTKKERDQIYLDLGFTSGTNNEVDSSGSEGPDPRLIRNSDMSDHGYYSYGQTKANQTLDPSTLTPESLYQHSMKLLELRMEHTKIKSRSLMYQVATEADVLTILTDFTIDFLLKGFKRLLSDVEELVSSDSTSTLELKEFFVWMLHFFLPLAADVGIPLKHIGLSFETLHFIISETLMNSLEIYVESRPRKHKIELVEGYIQAQLSFVQTINRYEANLCIDQADRAKLKDIQLQMTQVKNLRQLFVLLTRIASSKQMLSLKYLSNLVESNHIHLISIQQVASSDTRSQVNMTKHIEQFTYTDMMLPYVLLLERFSENTATVNDCIFTMMHHIAGDLNCPEALNIHSLPKTVRDIIKQGFGLCDDWKDLLEYLMNYFTSQSVYQSESSQSSSHNSHENSGTGGSTSRRKRRRPASHELMARSWNLVSGSNCDIASLPNSQAPPPPQPSQEALERSSSKQLQTSGSDSCSPPAEKRAKTSPGLTLSDQKTVGKPKDQESPAAKEGPGEKSDETSLTQEHDDEPKPDENKEGTEASKKNPESEMEKAEESVDEILNLNSKKIREVAEELVGAGQRELVDWLQTSLLDAWRVKLDAGGLYPNNVPLEPLPYHYNKRGLSTPLLPYSFGLNSCLTVKAFKTLIKLLSLEVKGPLVTIPFTHQPDYLLQGSLALGPVQHESLFPELAAQNL